MSGSNSCLLTAADAHRLASHFNAQVGEVHTVVSEPGMPEITEVAVKAQDFLNNGAVYQYDLS